MVIVGVWSCGRQVFMPDIRTLNLNPALDLQLFIPQPTLGILNRATRSYYEASGKGLNVSGALAAQGVGSKAIVPLGGPIGQVMRALLADTPFDLEIIPITGASRANTKVIEEETGTMTEFNAPGPPLGDAELAACREALLRDLTPGNQVVLSGSLPPTAPSDTYARLITDADRLEVAAYVDAAGKALELSLAAKPQLAKPNRHEAELLLGITIVTWGDALTAARRVQQAGAKQVVLSLGGDGAIFLAEHSCLIATPPPIQARSTTGCGDALIAGVLLGRREGWGWERTTRYATAMATARAVMEGPGFPDAIQVAAYQGNIRVASAADIDPEVPLVHDR